jgi:hypothetical protein
MTAAPDTTPLWKRLWLSLWRLEPLRMPRWEIFIVRLAFALLVWDTQTGWIAHWNDPPRAARAMVENASAFDIRWDSQPHPNGLAYLFDFTFIANDAIEYPVRYAMGVSLLLYVVGVPGAFTLAIPLFMCLAASTLANSQGSIGHTAQGLHLALLAVWLAALYAFIQKRRGRLLKFGYSSGEFELDWARQALSAAYVVSAITKLIVSNGLWFIDAKYFPLHILKNNEMQYYDTLEASARHLDWLPDLALQHPQWCQFLFGIALPLELFVFIGLRNRRAALLFGIGLIGFHQSVTELTHLSFIFNKLLLIILFVAPWHWLAMPFRRKQH